MFTFQQIQDFHKYEAVRSSGEFNMGSPQALMASHLPEERFIFVMQNFTALRYHAEKIKDLAMAHNMADKYDIHF